MKKYLILILLLCVGCRANYELKFNEDLTIDEKIVGVEDDNFYNLFDVSKNEVIGLVLTPNKDYMDDADYTIYNTFLDSQDGATAVKSYKDIEDYLKNSKVYLQYFSDLSIENRKGIVTFKVSNDHNENIEYSNRYVVDDGSITLIIPFRVIEHNADKYIESENKYIWDFNSNNQKDNIFIKFDTGNIKETTSSLVTIVFIVLVVIGVLGTIYIYNKRKDTRNEI